MTQAIKTVWNILTSLLVAGVAVLALLLAGARLFGFQVFTVLSGSMEPTYHTGSLIYVRELDTTSIPDGTVITFMLDEDTVATHRVVGSVPDEEDPFVIRYRTKGDANDAEDGSLVHYKNVIGTPVFTIPYLGYLASFIQEPPGTYIAITAGAILLMLVFLPDLLFEDEPEPVKKKKKKKRKKKKVATATATSATTSPRPATSTRPATTARPTAGTQTRPTTTARPGQAPVRRPTTSSATAKQMPTQRTATPQRPKPKGTPEGQRRPRPDSDRNIKS